MKSGVFGINPGGVVEGLTDPAQPSNPYVAKELSNLEEYAVFVHETANAIGLITGKFSYSKITDRYTYNDQNIEPSLEQQGRYEHNDPGIKVEECVFGRSITAD